MRLSRPSEAFFYISVVLAVLAVLVFTGTIALGIAPFWLMTAAYVVLLVGVITNN